MQVSIVLWKTQSLWLYTCFWFVPNWNRLIFFFLSHGRNVVHCKMSCALSSNETPWFQMVLKPMKQHQPCPAQGAPRPHLLLFSIRNVVRGIARWRREILSEWLIWRPRAQWCEIALLLLLTVKCFSWSTHCPGSTGKTPLFFYWREWPWNSGDFCLLKEKFRVLMGVKNRIIQVSLRQWCHIRLLKAGRAVSSRHPN